MKHQTCLMGTAAFALMVAVPGAATYQSNGLRGSFSGQGVSSETYVATGSFTYTFGDWTTVYLQPEYSETEYGADQDEFQLRKAYVVFGNLEKHPFMPHLVVR